MRPGDANRLLGQVSQIVAARMAAAVIVVATTVAAEVERRLATADTPPQSSDPSGTPAAAITVEAQPEGGAVVTVTHPAAAALEYGTTRMAARPFLRPAVDAKAGEAQDLLAASFAQAVAAAFEDIA